MYSNVNRYADTEIKIGIEIEIKLGGVMSARDAGDGHEVWGDVRCGVRGRAYVAFVRFLPRMNPDMLLQRLRGRELLIAVIALAALDYTPPNRG